MKLIRLGLSKKIWLSMALLILGYFISTMIGFALGRQMEGRMSKVSEYLFPASNFSKSASAFFKEEISLYNQGVMVGDKEKILVARNKSGEVKNALANILTMHGGDEKTSGQISAAISEHKNYTNEAQIVYLAMCGGDTNQAENAAKLFKTGEAIQNNLDSIYKNFEDMLQAELKSNVQLSKRQRFLNLIVFCSVVIFAVILIGWIINRSITGPLKRIAEGLNEGSDKLDSASQQVSSAGQSLSTGASQQAAAIEETSSAIEEMSSMIKKTAENAIGAESLMKETKASINTANQVMNQLKQSMEDISNASHETQRIIKTIDEIAFQTNLLALNAAVEAARAGEAGAGFAVVADEVRNLAMKAAGAAKETTRLIENTLKAVGNGNEFTVSTESAFQQNMEISNKVAVLITEISAATQDQSQGLQLMNRSMANISGVIQNVVDSGEETAQSSGELSAQSRYMRDIVNELVELLGMGENANSALPKHVLKLPKLPCESHLSQSLLT